MNVLLTLASSSVTGPAERMLQDAETLRAAGHAVAVAFDTLDAGTLGEACRARGLAIAEELTLSRHSSPAAVARDLLRLRRRLRAGVDLVHAHFSHDHFLALAASVGLGTRIVRSLESNETGSRFAIARSDGIEVPFGQLAESSRLAKLRRRKRVAILPAAVDAARFSPAASSKLRRALGLSAEVPLIGIVARIKPERRHADLIAAFASVAATTSAHLAIIGRGEGQGELEAQVRELALTERVHFAGYWSGRVPAEESPLPAADDLVEAYRGLDVAVWLVAGNDGAARGVLEAMAVAKPVVAYDTPPMDVQLADGSADPGGVLVPAGDVGALSTALRLLVDDPGKRARLGAAARARVLERYAPERRGQQLLAFYARVLETE